MSTLEHGLAGLRILIVDDENDVRLGLRLLLEPIAAEVRDARSGEEALAILEAWAPHVMLTDIVMGDLSGMDLLRRVRARRPQIEVIMITGYGTIELAVEAIREGAVQFITKPFDNREVLAEVEHGGRQALLCERARRIASGHEGPIKIIGEDPQMVSVLELVRRVAPTMTTVLIHGESGTGKELIARAIHQGSRDPRLPFLPVNAAALPDTLLEAELFGHVKGAFTGAERSREGIFAQARGGTVFLDEIASMSPAFQSKLLRVLQEHTVTPLGATTPRSVDFRLVAATNRRLRELIAVGEFREDLYYRLRVVSLNVPPLRERPGDIVLLAMHFLALCSATLGLGSKRSPRLTAEALQVLERHRWPGNVRELENCIQRALILSRGEDIQPRHLGLDEESLPWSREWLNENLSYEEGKQQVLAAYRRRALEQALRATHGNVSQAAERCGLTRAAFQRLMRSLDLDRKRFSKSKES